MSNRLLSFLSLLSTSTTVAVLLSCSGKPSPANEPGTQHFFDLKSYFSREVQALSEVGNVKKVTEVNGNREELVLDDIDFEQELKPFSEADINRPAWTDKYTIDSLFDESNALTKLTYTAIDPKLKTKRVEIDFESNSVSKVFIENSTASAVAKTRQLLTYEPGTGYSIQSTQKVVLTSDDTFFVEVRF